MTSPVDSLVAAICEQARYRVLSDHQLQQLCYDLFIAHHPPHPLPEPGRGSLSLKPGANEMAEADLPESWELFIGDARVVYTHATSLPWSIAGDLAGMVREALRREPLQMVQVDAR